MTTSLFTTDVELTKKVITQPNFFWCLFLLVTLLDVIRSASDTIPG